VLGFVIVIGIAIAIGIVLLPADAVLVIVIAVSIANVLLLRPHNRPQPKRLLIDVIAITINNRPSILLDPGLTEPHLIELVTRRRPRLTYHTLVIDHLCGLDVAHFFPYFVVGHGGRTNKNL